MFEKEHQVSDDVVVHFMSQARQQSSRTGPITVIIDDDSETTAGPAGIPQIILKLLFVVGCKHTCVFM